MANTGVVTLTDTRFDQTRLATFSGLTGASGTSPPFAIGSYVNATLAIQGTFDSATVLLNGSNDGGTTWYALKDYLGTAVSATSNGLFILGTLPQLLQVSWSGGDSSTSLTAYLGFSKTYF